MSDLGAIFHVKKDGTQYDAHAYSTEDECPSPHLCIKTKEGVSGYVTLVADDAGDVPLKVKKSDGALLQVNTSVAPVVNIGDVPYQEVVISLKADDITTIFNKVLSLTSITYKKFIIPEDVNIIKVVGNNTTSYVGVTPLKEYEVVNLYVKQRYPYHSNYHAFYNILISKTAIWLNPSKEEDTPMLASESINKQTPTVTDY